MVSIRKERSRRNIFIKIYCQNFMHHHSTTSIKPPQITPLFDLSHHFIFRPVRNTVRPCPYHFVILHSTERSLSIHFISSTQHFIKCLRSAGKRNNITTENNCSQTECYTRLSTWSYFLTVTQNSNNKML